MNAIWLLLGLLVLAYTGSMLVGGRAIRGYGLPSGAEYLLLGVLVGPNVLGVLQPSMVETFQPVLAVALGWLALVVGVDYGMVGERRVSIAHLAAGLSWAMVAVAGVTAACAVVAHRFLGIGGDDLWVLSLGLGLALAETTRHAVRWVVERHEAAGPLSDLLADLADAADAVPLLALAVVFALAPGGSPLEGLALSGLGLRIALPVAGGILLGLVGGLLLRHERRLHESWGLLLGVALLGIGVATLLEVATLTLMFVLGVVLALVSAQRDEIRAMVDATERPVLLPVLWLAGATVDLRLEPRLYVVVGVGLVARLVLRQLGGGLLATARRSLRASGSWIGLGGLSSGAVTVSVALSCRLRLGAPYGDAILLAAALSILIGELVGPTSLRRALERAGELPVRAAESETPADDGAPA